MGKTSDSISKLVDDLVPKDVQDFVGYEKKKKGPIGAIANLLDNLNGQTAPVQAGIGSGAGLVTGYVFTKGSKAVATCLGLSLIAFTFAEHRGYVKLNRSQFEKDVNTVKRRIEKELYGKSAAVDINKDDVGGFLADHAYLLGGFAAGCLIGYGLA